MITAIRRKLRHGAGVGAGAEDEDGRGGSHVTGL
jgi:hypothetical protein